MKVFEKGMVAMRKLKPRPKDRRKVAIPDELRESLREVFELIQQARHDPDIQLVSMTPFRPERSVADGMEASSVPTS